MHTDATALMAYVLKMTSRVWMPTSRSMKIVQLKSGDAMRNIMSWLRSSGFTHNASIIREATVDDGVSTAAMIAPNDP